MSHREPQQAPTLVSVEQQTLSAQSDIARRTPAVPVACFIAAGIGIDALLEIPSLWWMLMTWAGFIGWILTRRRNDHVITCSTLLLTTLCLGGLRHHITFSNFPANDLSLFASDDRQPVHLIGRIASEPEVSPPAAPSPLTFTGSETAQTAFLIQSHQLRSGHQETPVSGLISVRIAGDRHDLKPGDQVSVRGSLSRPGPPKNPGEFDFQTYQRRQQIRCSVFVSHPDAVQVDTNSPRSAAGRPLNTIRRQFRSLVSSELQSNSSALALALLLGDRSHLSPETEDRFIQTGTMHLLAISGLHVGILATFLYFCCRILFSHLIFGQFIPARMQRWTVWITPVVVGSGVVAYAAITLGRPSTVRAALFICLGLVAFQAYRRLAFFNTLAAAAICLLLWQPSDLFDTGAQLSFMAVAVIGVVSRWDLTRYQKTTPLSSRFRQSVAKIPGSWIRFLAVSTGVWLVVAPLVANRFHVVSPIAILGNLVLIPAMWVVLWIGYLFLMLGSLIPPAASLLGILFDGALQLLQQVVAWGADLPGSSFYLPGPSSIWIAIFYLLLIGLFFMARSRPQRKTWALTLMIWTIGGLTLSLLPRTDQKLRCTFLAMGHGCSVIVEMPNGRTLLYDAGSLSGPIRAEQTVSQALWQRGTNRVDAVVLSHADIDHFNALPGLLSKIPVSQLLVGRPFFQGEQASADWLGEVAYANHVPISIVGTDDEIGLDRDVTLRVLHPNLKTTATPTNDNAGSVVLTIEYAGRRILLTGDLEHEGLIALVQQTPLDVDVMLSPHHGSLAANPPDLPRWARPEWLVISSGDASPAERLRPVYGPGTALLPTSEFGAVTFEIEPTGELTLSSFMTDENPD